MIAKDCAKLVSSKVDLKIPVLLTFCLALKTLSPTISLRYKFIQLDLQIACRVTVFSITLYLLKCFSKVLRLLQTMSLTLTIFINLFEKFLLFSLTFYIVSHCKLFCKWSLTLFANQFSYLVSMKLLSIEVRTL